MAIKHRPKVGEILECDFGQWADPVHFDGHIKPEMRKRRMVVVLNGKLDGQSCLVVPISSSNTNQTGFLQKYHVLLPTEAFPITDHYDERDRWALGERVAVVSTTRLFYIAERGVRYRRKLERDVVTEIQKHVICALNAQALLNNQQ